MANQDEASNLTEEDRAYLDKYSAKLSAATKQAKWINSSDQHENHPGQALATRNHQVIETWASQRQASPATVAGTEHNGHLGVLRFDFPGFGGEDLKKVDWADWFKAFDARELTFVFQEKMENGRESNFFKLDSPFREDA